MTKIEGEDRRSNKCEMIKIKRKIL